MYQTFACVVAWVLGRHSAFQTTDEEAFTGFLACPCWCGCHGDLIKQYLYWEAGALERSVVTMDSLDVRTHWGHLVVHRRQRVTMTTGATRGKCHFVELVVCELVPDGERFEDWKSRDGSIGHWAGAAGLVSQNHRRVDAISWWPSVSHSVRSFTASCFWLYWTHLLLNFWGTEMVQVTAVGRTVVSRMH